MGRTASTETQCLYSSVIPLLHLWTVRPVQTLSACTVQLYLYSPMGRTACTEPQCLYSAAIPLLPLWAVRPVQSLCSCTVQLYLYAPYGPYGLYIGSVPVQYSYTSTPPMGRTVCTELQCLYNRALYLFYTIIKPECFAYVTSPKERGKNYLRVFAGPRLKLPLY